jgi:predicted HicB family RNase H-like nuclease
MDMSKLTVNVDEKVERGAKRYAAAHGMSVSSLVERYLDLLSRPFDMARAFSKPIGR